jgi:hypothetical protein
MIGIDRYDHMIHFCRRNHIERNYRNNSIMKILKSSYLNLNICKVVQVFWEVLLLDRILLNKATAIGFTPKSILEIKL